MPNLAQVGSVVCVVSLVLAFSGGIAHAGISSVCVAADGSAASLLVQVDDKKSKKKKHNQESGLSECTIYGPGAGGGCKSGFNWKCEKLKSGKKCCGCVADKGTSAGQSAPTSGGGNPSGGGIKPEQQPADSLVLPYFECDLSKGPCDLPAKE